MIELNVPDMSCGHCVSTITRAVKEVDSEGSIDVDLQAHKVRIGSGHAAAEFVSALTKAGYTPSIAANG